MKIIKSQSRKKRTTIIVALAVAVALLLSVGTYAWFKSTGQLDDNGTSSNNDSNPTSDPPNTQTEGNSSKEAIVTQEEAKNTDQSPTPTGTPSIKVVGYEQKDGLVTTTTQGFNTGQGKCVFTFTTSDARPVVREVNSSNEACTTSIPSVEFSKVGIWSLNVKFMRNGTKVTETNQNVTVN